MIISVFMRNEKGNIIDGTIQIDDIIKETENGSVSFDIEAGEKILRFMSFGYRGGTTKIEISYEGQDFTVIVRRG